MILVYVLNKDGKPLMPTNARKARLLLKANKAKVVNRTPFTIQLLYGSTGYKQEVVLGVDSGSKNIGLSATTKSKELFSGEVLLRSDVQDKIATRKELRRTRRSRKTRYRKVRFLNRVKNKKEGWLPPSTRQKIDSHINIINKILKFLPISKVIIETASFDTQKIKNPSIKGKEYQQGSQLDFWNVREYVLHRDNHTCQCCHGKSKDKILNVHHIESRKTGGNSPDNLITLCETCHNNFHKGLIPNFKPKRTSQSLRDAAFMNTMRWYLYNKLKEILEIPVYNTYGYITKSKRIANKLPKTHSIDGLVISGNLRAKPLDYSYIYKCLRVHNRQIHKQQFKSFKKLKNKKGFNPTDYPKGYRELNQIPFSMFHFNAYDKVKAEVKDKKTDRVIYIEGFICSRRQTGCFTIIDIESNPLIDVSYKKLKLLESRSGEVVGIVKRDLEKAS